jgi:hypothetical protein
MSKLDSLIALVNSLSKAERKKISSMLNSPNRESDYIYLFRLIDKDHFTEASEIKRLFVKRKPDAALNVTVSYLFDALLDILTGLRSAQDSYFILFKMILQAKVLYEKSVYTECFLLLNKVQADAIYYENFPVLLIAQKMELEFLLSLDFQEISEEELLTKQLKVSETLKKIRKTNEHTLLFELLRHRILYKGNTNLGGKQKQELNDLVVSEMSIVASSGFNNFEIEKNHKLFQSNYLMNVGDYKSALNSFYELNNTFEKNMHLLSNPPMYYLVTIEGVLESLRTTRNYDSMNYFVEKLNAIQSSSSHFKMQVLSAVFLYKLFPLIDRGYFVEARNLMDEFKENLFDKASHLISARQFRLMFYAAVVYFDNGDYEKAKKMFFKVFYIGKNSISEQHYKAGRLLHLLSFYELNDVDSMDIEIRSIRRELKKSGHVYQTEMMLLKMALKPVNGLYNKERQLLWKKIEPKVQELYANRSEIQLLRIFDFGAWIEAKIRNMPLEKILQARFASADH